MTTRKESLQELLAKVEAGDGIEYAAYRAAFPHPSDREHEPVKNMDRARIAFMGSLDAAKALHEAVLPNYGWMVSDHKLRAIVYTELGPGGTSQIAVSITPARAWLIAIIKALIAEADQ